MEEQADAIRRLRVKPVTVAPATVQIRAAKSVSMATIQKVLEERRFGEPPANRKEKRLSKVPSRVLRGMLEKRLMERTGIKQPPPVSARSVAKQIEMLKGLKRNVKRLEKMIQTLVKKRRQQNRRRRRRRQQPKTTKREEEEKKETPHPGEQLPEDLEPISDYY